MVTRTTSTGIPPEYLKSVPQRETYVRLDFEPLERIHMKVGANAAKIYPLIREICMNAGKDEECILRIDIPDEPPIIDFQILSSEIVRTIYTTFDPSKILIDSEWFCDGDAPTISVKQHIICLQCADQESLIAEVYFNEDDDDQTSNHWEEVKECE